jgi:hypothetical protein
MAGLGVNRGRPRSHPEPPADHGPGLRDWGRIHFDNCLAISRRDSVVVLSLRARADRADIASARVTVLV